MAKEIVTGKRRDSTTGSFPAGNGGRVRIPIWSNDEGMDHTIEPDDDIGSAMMLRTARQTGRFTPPYSRED